MGLGIWQWIEGLAGCTRMCSWLSVDENIDSQVNGEMVVERVRYGWQDWSRNFKGKLAKNLLWAKLSVRKGGLLTCCPPPRYNFSKGCHVKQLKAIYCGQAGPATPGCLCNLISYPRINTASLEVSSRTLLCICQACHWCSGNGQNPMRIMLYKDNDIGLCGHYSLKANNKTFPERGGLLQQIGVAQMSIHLGGYMTAPGSSIILQDDLCLHYHDMSPNC